MEASKKRAKSSDHACDCVLNELHTTRRDDGIAIFEKLLELHLFHIVILNV